MNETIVVAPMKAAEGSRTPKPHGRNGVLSFASAFWSAAVLCRFFLGSQKVKVTQSHATTKTQRRTLEENLGQQNEYLRKEIFLPPFFCLSSSAFFASLRFSLFGQALCGSPRVGRISSHALIHGARLECTTIWNAPAERSGDGAFVDSAWPAGSKAASHVVCRRTPHALLSKRLVLPRRTPIHESYRLFLDIPLYLIMKRAIPNTSAQGTR
jgi:hypothetical protein